MVLNLYHLYDDIDLLAVRRLELGLGLVEDGARAMQEFFGLRHIRGSDR